MIDIKLFKEKTFLEKLKISLFNLPPEKTFYSGTALFLSLIILTISIFYYFSKKTIEVPSKNQNITIGVVGNFKYFNPIYAQSSSDTFMSGMLYSGLLKKNVDGSWSKDLAENINIDENGNKVDVQIKNTAKFSNGESILTDDIIFTYELAVNILADGVNRVKYEGLTFDKIDDKNFSITLSKNFSNISEILSLGILSKVDYENESFETLESSEKGFYSLTSGIYKIDKFVKNSNNSSSLSLSVNNNKYSSPNIKYINIDSYSDEETLLQDVSNGKSVDFIYNLNRELDASNENFSEYNKKEYVTPVITAIFLNPNKKDILAKKNLRKNIYYGVERETISSGALGQAKSSFDILPGSNFRNDLVKETEISVSSSSTINLTIVDNEKQNKIAENIKTSLGKIGLNINIIKEDQSNVINSIIKNRDFEMLLYSIEVNNLEDLYAFWHSSQRNAPGLNITNYTSTNLDKNLNIIKTSTSTTEIQESLESMVKEFYDEYPYIPLYTSVEYIYKKNNLTINSPDQISNKKEITSDIINWYKDKEKIWPIIKKYENQITKIYKLIH
jgi:peptide/nickel transport system substrate-binding protein